MTSLVFLAARVFPFWAVPLAIVLADVGRHFRRRRDKRQFLFFGLAGSFIILTLLWAIFRGDKNSEEWVRLLLRI